MFLFRLILILLFRLPVATIVTETNASVSTDFDAAISTSFDVLSLLILMLQFNASDGATPTDLKHLFQMITLLLFQLILMLYFDRV